MPVAEAQAPSLFGLIGRQWAAGAAVEGCVFDASGTVVAFALASGSVAIAPLEDAESTVSRFRVSVDSGRATISPRAKPPPPLLQVPIGDAPLRIAAFGPSGFIAGTACGRLVRVSPTGFLLPVAADADGPIEAIAGRADGSVLVACGGAVTRHALDGAPAQRFFEIGTATTALAVARDGRRIAAATATGLTLWDAETPAAAARTVDLAGVDRLSWSPDGARLAAALASGGIALVDGETGAVVAHHADYPAPGRSLSWSRDGRRLVTSGAFRVVAWPVEDGGDAAGDQRSIETGRASLVAVSAVDVRADRQLVAAGNEIGMVVVSEIGRRDELLVKGPGDGTVHDLRWSHDGRHLAFGTSAGMAALVEFPPHLFK
jgi:hypothetical protein